MRRLYLQIYGAFLLVSLVWVAVTGVTVHLLFDVEDPFAPTHLRRATALLLDDLAPAQAPEDAQAAALDGVADKLGARMTLYDPDRRVVASAGGRPLAPPPDADDVYWFHDGGPALMMRLDDGRWLAAGVPGDHRTRFGRFLVVLASVTGVMAVGSYVVARRITRRLEGLRNGVDRLGQGDLSARVDVLGDDEVAELARRFNQAADRIEALIGGQRRMLASASHELRSPLARLRMAVEMLDDGDPHRRALLDGAEKDVAELDELVGDLLLASRLEARPIAREDVDLGAIAAEEAARVGATSSAATSSGATSSGATSSGTVVVRGDARALRRMVRNLVENGRRYGGDVEVSVTADGVVVADRGPGVPEAERERIFEPFYRPAGHREGEDGGVGLGLALVRQIARAHGGDVRYEPREGGGSRFVVTLG